MLFNKVFVSAFFILCNFINAGESSPSDEELPANDNKRLYQQAIAHQGVVDIPVGREAAVAAQAVQSLSDSASASSSDIRSLIIRARFSVDNEHIYRRYSETFAAVEKPWENSTVINSKERIGRELLVSSLDLPDEDEKAILIASSAALGVPVACLYHYEGVKSEEHGFKVDTAKATQLHSYTATQLHSYTATQLHSYKDSMDMLD